MNHEELAASVGADGVEIDAASSFNSSERSRRLKFYKSELKKWLKRKPSVNIHEKDDQKRYAAQMRLNKWATHVGVIRKKISEYEAKQDHKRLHQPSKTEDGSARREHNQNGGTKDGHMQGLSDLR